MSKKQLKKCAFNSTEIIILVFFFGCASKENNIKEDTAGLYTPVPFIATNEELVFRNIEARNSIIAYKEFIQKYSQGEFTSEAKKRIAESDDEAFVRTAKIRTIDAFQGFIESYPESKYTLEIKDYFAWMEKSKIGVLLTFPSSDGKADSLKKDLIININKYQHKFGRRIIILKDLDEEKINNIKVMISVNYSRTDPTFGEITKYSAIFAQTILFFPAAIVGLALDAATYPFKIVKSWYATIKCVSVPEGVEYEKSGSPNDISTEDNFLKKIHEAEFIAWISESNIPPLGFLNIIFQTGDEYFKWSILNALDRTNKKTTDLFSLALRDKNLRVRMCAAKALCNQNDPRGYDVLQSAIQDNDFDLRVMTIRSLKEIKSSNAVQLLVLALKNDLWGVQLEAIKALSEIKDSTTIKPLIDAFDKDNSYFVTMALKEITGQDLGEDKKKWQEWYEQNMIK